MAYVLQKVIDTVTDVLSGPGGIPVQLEQLAGEEPELAHSIAGFVIRGFTVKRGVNADEDVTTDPRIRIQVDRLENSKRLKYAPFSGSCQLSLFVEAADARQELVTAQLNAISDAILLVLDNHNGCLGPGIYYGGGYELSLSAMEKGGPGFRQVAQVKLELTLDEGGGL
jgi:hypothetical protein